MPDYANIGPESGPSRYRDDHDATGVHQARDNHAPIGMALGIGWDDEGRLLYRLTVHGADVPRRWVAVVREFRTAE